jgi:short-subunit dehydrogenase
MAAPDAASKFAEAISDIDVGLFIYNAALEPQGLFVDETTEELLGNITVNCVTPTLLTHQLAPTMIKRGRGGIVLVSSMGALQGIKVFAAYGAAKSYELILAEGLWDELRDHGIDACAYVIGSTATPTFLERQKSMKTPDEATLKSVFGGVGDGVSNARDPKDVAAALFPQLGQGPRLFSHPADEQAADFMATMPRKDTVELMGKISSMFWE